MPTRRPGGSGRPPRSRAAKDTSADAGDQVPRSPTEQVRDAADALLRAALECCHQRDRLPRVLDHAAADAEVKATQHLCELCDDTLRDFTTDYERVSAAVRPDGLDAGWWHRANALWLASREYLRHQADCDSASRSMKDHGPDDLSGLHAEYELEASALLGLRHAAEAYRRDRPTAV